jgi:flagellar hook-basal body complex protein FliE
VTVDPIQSGALSAAVAPAPQPAAAAPSTSADFAALLTQGLDRVDGSLHQADASLQALATGEPVAVHDVVIAMEQARVAMQFAVETRNRVVEAYQEFMRMQL